MRQEARYISGFFVFAGLDFYRGGDVQRIETVIEYYAGKLGLTTAEAIAGIINRVREQRIKYNEEGEIVIEKQEASK